MTVHIELSTINPGWNREKNSISRDEKVTGLFFEEYGETNPTLFQIHKNNLR